MSPAARGFARPAARPAVRPAVGALARALAASLALHALALAWWLPPGRPRGLAAPSAPMVLRVAPPRVEPALPAPVAAAVRERVVGAPARARAGAPPERARASAEPAPHAPPIVPAPDAARAAPIIRAPVERTIVAIAPDDAIATPEQYRVALAFAARRLQPPPGDGDALDAAVRATVRITFTPLGRLDDVSLVASSGSAALDAAAIALGSAVHAALPLPPRLHGRVASVDLTVAAARAAASAAGP